MPIIQRKIAPSAEHSSGSAFALRSAQAPMFYRNSYRRYAGCSARKARAECQIQPFAGGISFEIWRLHQLAPFVRVGTRSTRGSDSITMSAIFQHLRRPAASLAEGNLESPRDAEPTISLSGTHESSTASDGFSVLLHDVLAEGLDDCHQLLMLSCRHLVLVKGL